MKKNGLKFISCSSYYRRSAVQKTKDQPVLLFLIIISSHQLCSQLTADTPKVPSLFNVSVYGVTRVAVLGWSAAAAAAKSLQSWPTLCDPIDGSPPGSSVPGILQARTLEWVAISFSISQVPSPFLLPLPSPISQVPLIQKLSMPRWHILGWHTLLPFNYIHLNLKKKVE